MENIEKKLFSCRECEIAIIEGSADRIPEAAEHLANCPACQEFARFQQTVLQAQVSGTAEPPSFSQICSAHRRQKQMRLNCLKFIVLPTAAAAALLLTAGGVFFHMQSNQSRVPQSKAEYAILTDAAAFAQVMAESSVTLAWDKLSPRENAARNLVSDARKTSDWSIEMFNPYNSEDL